MTESIQNHENGIKELSILLKEIEKKVLENRAHHDDSEKTIKDLRRIFDQNSSKMNEAIFNGYPAQEVYQGTLCTISILVEVMLRTKKTSKSSPS